LAQQLERALVPGLERVPEQGPEPEREQGSEPELAPVSVQALGLERHN